jgi:hypothetical protein
MMPSFEVRTDFGAIDPSMVFINFNELFLATSSPWAGRVTKENERNTLRSRKTFRMH